MKLQAAALCAALLAFGWLGSLTDGASDPTSGRPIVASLPPTSATSAAAGSSALASKSSSSTAASTRSPVAASLPATGGTASQVNYRDASIGGTYTSARPATNATATPTVTRQTQPAPAIGSSYVATSRDNGSAKVGSPSVTTSTLPTTKANPSASASGEGVLSSGAATSSRLATTSTVATTATSSRLATTSTVATTSRPLFSEKSSVAAGSTSNTVFQSGSVISSSMSTAKTSSTTTRLKMSLVGLPVNASSGGDVGRTAVNSYIPSKAVAGMVFAMTCSVIGQPVTNLSVVSSTGEKILECTATAQVKAYGAFAKYLDTNLSPRSCAAALNASAANGSAAATFYFTAADTTLTDGYYRCSATYWNGSSLLSAIDDQVWPFVVYTPPTSLLVAPSPLSFVDGSPATVNCSTFAKPPADLLLTVDCKLCDFVSVAKMPQEINAFTPAGYSYATARFAAAAKWNGAKITCNVTNHQIFTNSFTSSVAIQSSSLPLSSTEIFAAALVQTTSTANNEITPWGKQFYCIAGFSFVYSVLHRKLMQL